MYFCKIKDFPRPERRKADTRLLISSSLSVHVIPCPLFENSPGLIIQ